MQSTSPSATVGADTPSLAATADESRDDDCSPPPPPSLLSTAAAGAEMMPKDAAGTLHPSFKLTAAAATGFLEICAVRWALNCFLLFISSEAATL